MRRSILVTVKLRTAQHLLDMARQLTSRAVDIMGDAKWQVAPSRPRPDGSTATPSEVAWGRTLATVQTLARVADDATRRAEEEARELTNDYRREQRDVAFDGSTHTTLQAVLRGWDDAETVAKAWASVELVTRPRHVVYNFGFAPTDGPGTQTDVLWSGARASAMTLAATLQPMLDEGEAVPA